MDMKEQLDYNPYGRDLKKLKQYASVDQGSPAQKGPSPKKRVQMEVPPMNERQRQIDALQRKNEGRGRGSPQRQQQQQQEGSPYPAQKAKITNFHEQVSYQEAEQQYSKKMTYAEEL